MSATEHIDCRIASLAVHPIKSCAAVATDECLLVETGLQFDRQWMVVDEHGEMFTQRELPRMALVQGRFKGEDLILRAPGMLALHLSLDHVEAATRVRVWDDEVRAYDMGALAGQWMRDFLGHAAPLRIVRFDPEERRLSDAKWTGPLQAENHFSDGFPILVAGSASLADFNQRHVALGGTAVDMRRFRPNLVLDGLQPWDEDHLDELRIEAEGGDVVLKLVKPCSRCSMPSVDPDRGEAGQHLPHSVGQTLASFRADARLNGALTFGMNAVIVSGVDHVLRVGQPVRASWAL